MPEPVIDVDMEEGPHSHRETDHWHIAFAVPCFHLSLLCPVSTCVCCALFPLAFLEIAYAVQFVCCMIAGLRPR